MGCLCKGTVLANVISVGKSAGTRVKNKIEKVKKVANTPFISNLNIFINLYSKYTYDPNESLEAPVPPVAPGFCSEFVLVCCISVSPDPNPSVFSDPKELVFVVFS